MLVSVGSALLMLVSAYGFSPSLKPSLVVLDPSRVAAQVVSGIGFLGAGTILMRKEIVKGLTTAAGIWAVAAVGLAVGGGLYGAALSVLPYSPPRPESRLTITSREGRNAPSGSI